MKKTTLYNLIATFFITMGVSSCADFLDQENPAYDAEGFYATEAGLKEGVTGIYPLLYFDMNWAVPACIVLDHYTAYGLEQDENSSIGAGGTLNPDNLDRRISNSRPCQFCNLRCQRCRSRNE